MGDIKNLVSAEAVAKIKELAEAADVCMFTTGLDNLPLVTRPMSTREVDEEGNIWFFSRSTSEKNAQIADDDRVQLFYSNNGNYEYLSVFGRAEIVTDREKAAELWSAMAKAWFPGGVDDPELTMIKVIPADSYYWDTKSNKFVSLLKFAGAALTGKPMDDGIEGGIEV